MARIIVLDDLSQDGLDLLQSAGNIEVVVRTGLKGDDLRNALAGGRRRHLPQRRENHRRGAGRQPSPAGDRPGGGGRGQHRHRGRHPPGHRGDEHPRRQHHLHGRAHARPDAGAVAQPRPPPTRAWSERRWDRKKYMGTQLAGKTLGIVGLGRVGHAVATRALALAMQGPRLRSVPLGRPGQGTGHPDRRQRPGDVPPGRLPHGPYAAERRDAKPDRSQGSATC